jgi:hypothetical protein
MMRKWSDYKMEIRELTVYAIKSNRKNTKCKHISFRIFGGDPKLKNQFKYDLVEMSQWINVQEYTKYKLVVYSNNINLHNWNTRTFYSKEHLLQVAETFMELFNKENIVLKEEI